MADQTNNVTNAQGKKPLNPDQFNSLLQQLVPPSMYSTNAGLPQGGGKALPSFSNLTPQQNAQYSQGLSPAMMKAFQDEIQKQQQANGASGAFQ